MRGSETVCGWGPVGALAAATWGVFADPTKTLGVAVGWPESFAISVGAALLAVAVLSLLAFAVWHRRPWRRPREPQRDLARQLLEQAEAERKRVAQAIHDGLGHQLLALKTAAAQVRDHPTAAAGLREHLEAISTLASQSLEQARGIAYRLRPFELDQLGLKAALEALVADVFDGSDLRVFKNLEALPEQFTPTQNVHLFRLVQEAFNNVIHHAHAANVMIEAKQSGTGLCLQIEDDGTGFNVRAVQQAPGSGLGLARMETHAHAAGGRLDIASAPGRGTRLSATIPLGKSEAG